MAGLALVVLGFGLLVAWLVWAIDSCRHVCTSDDECDHDCTCEDES